MSGFFKWIAIVLLIIALPLIAGLGLLLVKPDATLSWLLRNTVDMEYVADQTAVGLWPVAVDLENAEIHSAATKDVLLQLKSGSLRFHLWSYLTNAPSVWSLRASDVTFYAPAEPAPDLSASPFPGPSEPADTVPLDLALPLAFGRLAIDRFTVKPAEGDAISLSVDLERKETTAEPDQDSGREMASAAARISLHQPNEADFTVAGVLRYRLGSTNRLELFIPALNLNPLLSAQPEGNGIPADDVAVAGHNPSVEIAGGESQASSAEAAVDWSWMSSLGSLNLLLHIDELQAAEHRLHDFKGAFSSELSTLRLRDLSGRYEMLNDGGGVLVSQTFGGQLELIPLESLTNGADARIDLSLDGDHFKFGLAGIANLNAANGNQLKLSLDVSDFQMASRLLNKDLGPYSPFALATNFSVAEDRVTLANLKLNAGASDLQGGLAVSLAKSPDLGLAGVREVEGKITANQLVLQPLADLTGDDPETVEKTAVTTKNASNDAAPEVVAKVFSPEPLPLEALGGFEADVSVTAKRLKILEADFSEFVLTATSNKGVLRIEPGAKFGGGGFDGHFDLAPKSEEAELEIQFNLTDIDLEAFELVSKDELTGGKTDLDLSIQSSGASTAELAANSKGLILLTVVDAVVQNDTFELAGSDLIMEALSKLNPFGKTDPTTKLNCALVKFDGADGVWSTKNQLVVETEKMEIVGTGKIDLNSEELDIGITPSAKGGVGVNVGSLVKFLKLGGPLTSPRPQADAAGLLKSGVAIGAAASTGGLSILADGLAKRLLNAGDACTSARTGSE